MTCREKLKIEHPDKISPIFTGGCQGCPSFYGYMDVPDYCGSSQDGCINILNCKNCWDREIPDHA